LDIRELSTGKKFTTSIFKYPQVPLNSKGFLLIFFIVKSSKNSMFEQVGAGSGGGAAVTLWSLGVLLHPVSTSIPEKITAANFILTRVSLIQPRTLGMGPWRFPVPLKVPGV
jgi:hypothetical protein